MGAAYTIGGVLIGVLSCKASPTESAWGALIIPAAMAFIVGWILEEQRR